MELCLKNTDKSTAVLLILSTEYRYRPVLLTKYRVPVPPVLYFAKVPPVPVLYKSTVPTSAPHTLPLSLPHTPTHFPTFPPTLPPPHFPLNIVCCLQCSYSTVSTRDCGYTTVLRISRFKSLDGSVSVKYRNKNEEEFANPYRELCCNCCSLYVQYRA